MTFCFQIFNKFYSTKSLCLSLYLSSSHLRLSDCSHILLAAHRSGVPSKQCFSPLAPTCFREDPDSGMLQELPFIQCFTPGQSFSLAQGDAVLQLSAGRYSLFLPPNSSIVIICISIFLIKISDV